MRKKTFTTMPSKEYFAMYLAEEKMWWYVGLRDLLLRYVKKYATSKSIILDAGCGTGKNMEALIKNGYTVKGIDYSDDALKYTRMRGIRTVKKATVTKMPFRGKTFDIVISTDVLGIFKHEEDVKKTLNECWRVLKPQGYLLLQVSALPWLYSQHDAYIRFKKRFYKRELEEYLPAKKWIIKKSSYRIFFLFLIVALIKLIKQASAWSKKPKSDQIVPPGILNWLLLQLQLVENDFFLLVDFPIGSSIFIVAQKK